eukprot:1226365-Pyramimonas_sp.AAC.1
MRGPPQDLAAPLEGLRPCATVATFAGSWEARQRRVRRGPPRDLAAPWGRLRPAQLSPLSRALSGPRRPSQRVFRSRNGIRMKI